MVAILLALSQYLLVGPEAETPSPTESDIFVHLRDSLEEAGIDVVAPSWRPGENVRLSTDELERLVIERQCAAVFIEVAFIKGTSLLANVDLDRLARRVQVVAVVPDMYFRPNIGEMLKSFAGPVDRFLIFGNAELVEPILTYNGLDPKLAERFVDLGGMPVPRHKAPAEKIVDFCYIGTARKFRGRLLKSVVAHKYMRTFICTAGRQGRIGNTGLERVAGFMDVLACCKAGLWTRAGSGVRIDGRRYAGGVTARFNEYLAASVIPVFWGEERRFPFRKPEAPPAPDLVEDLHYIRVKDARDLKRKVTRICYEADVYDRMRRAVDDLYRDRFSSRIITRRMLTALGIS
jgi:hypothetical protein